MTIELLNVKVKSCSTFYGSQVTKWTKVTQIEDKSLCGRFIYIKKELKINCANKNSILGWLGETETPQPFD